MSMAMAEVPLNLLNELLIYDPVTGLLTRRKSAGGRCGKMGTKVGTVSPDGYLRIRMRGTGLLAHRVIWAMANGSWPDGEIDHINGERLDNRLVNLRCVSKRVNLQNQRRAPRGSRSGLLGVVPRPDGKFHARITVSRQVHLGTFETASEAHEAYLKAKRDLHEGCTI